MSEQHNSVSHPAIQAVLSVFEGRVIQTKARIGDGGDDGSAQRAQFLAALHRGLTCVVELRALPSRTKAFVATGDDRQVEQFAAVHAHENVFVGVATRIDQTSGALTNCRHLRAVWIDFDVKNAPKTVLEN